MSDFLDAVARRAIGTPVGLRPAAPPWIPPADARGRTAQFDRPPIHREPSPPDATRPEDIDVEPWSPVEATMASPAERALRRSRRKGPTAEAADTRPPEPTDRTLTNDQPPSEGRRPDRPVRLEPSPAEPPGPERSRPLPPGERLADAAEVLPVAVSALADNRATEPVPPDGTVRPLASLDRSADDGRWGDRNPVDVDDDRPVVHVSIGRVEVRAPQPPPAPPARAPIVPGLTLDEYLRRRDEAERR